MLFVFQTNMCAICYPYYNQFYNMDFISILESYQMYPSKSPYQNNVWVFSLTRHVFSCVVPRLCFKKIPQKGVKRRVYGTCVVSILESYQMYPSKSPYQNNVWDFSLTRHVFSCVVPRLCFKKIPQKGVKWEGY